MININKKFIYLMTIIFLVSSCGGGGGGGSDPVAPVIPPTPAPTINFSSDITDGYINDDITLTWSSTNATSCAASGNWEGSKGTAGSEMVYFTSVGEKSFTLECTGSGGSTSASVSVSISYQPLETARYSRSDGTDIFVDRGTNNLFHLGLIPRYLTKKHSGYTYTGFETPIVFEPGFFGDLPLSCRSANLNGDDFPDAVLGTAIGFSGGDDTAQYDLNNPEIRERVHFLINNGDGSFSSGKNLIDGQEYHRVTSYKEVHIGDLNGDGLDDIATESDSGGGLVRGNGILLLVSQPDGSYKDETFFHMRRRSTPFCIWHHFFSSFSYKYHLISPCCLSNFGLNENCLQTQADR